MPDVLAAMAASSRDRVHEARGRVREGELMRRAALRPAPPPLRLDSRFDVIAEIKPASPSAGCLAPTGDALIERARRYEAAGACAISVLTEPTAFAGSLGLLEEVANATTLPLMRKDFLVDPYQVAEARDRGASGVLLIARLLDDRRLAEMIDASRALGLFVLLEAFDEDDRDRAIAAAASSGGRVLAGINARDLATLAVDRERFARLGAPGARLVAESGLGTAEDVASVAALGYRVALVGEALMRDADPSPRLAAMLAAGRDATALRHPGPRGRFGAFGGTFVPETLVEAVARLDRAAREALVDPGFRAELETTLRDWVGRPTPLTHAARLSGAWGARILLKREDLAHTGAHKINNAAGQALLARRMGASRVVAETGAGQHGVAAAAACARLGLPCRVYMGEDDVARQPANAERIVRFGADLVPVASGDRTLRAAIDEALRAWVADPEGTYYMIGSVVGPHPYPWLVRVLQSVIGREARDQVLASEGRLPDAVAACVGGGSNAMGLFGAFLDDPEVQLLGFEAGGRGIRPGEHAATCTLGTPGVLHGARTLILQDGDGQVIDAHSIAPGLDYPGVGPEHAALSASGRVRYEAVSDREAMQAMEACCALEGILPALESAHALAGARRFAAGRPGVSILVGLSGRGDKDLHR